MKKILALLLAVVFIFTLTACGEKETSAWEEFINEYDAWVDEYIEISQKYAENPTDATILTDYTKMAGEAAEWIKKADNLENDLTAEEAAEYSAELEKITEKLASAAK